MRILESQPDVAQLLDLVRDRLEPRVPQHLVLALGGNSIETFWLGLKNGLRLHFDSMICLKYQFLNISLV